MYIYISYISLILSFIYFPDLLSAQEKDTTRSSLLWEISGEDIKEPSYLYGTIHISDKCVFAYDSIVEEKLYECDAYAMEILMDNIDAETLKNATIMEDNSLDQLLGEKDYEFLDSVFTEKLGISIMLFNKVKPFFIAAELMQEVSEGNMSLPMDLYFLELAKKANKKTLGIEKFQDQVDAIDKIPLEQQVELLLKGLRDTTFSEEPFEEMLESYMSAELEKMSEMTNDTLYPDQFHKAFNIDRNKNMALNIVRIIKEQTTFCAVGAAHLGGEKGVINLLRQQGFILKPIPFSFKKF